MIGRAAATVAGAVAAAGAALALIAPTVMRDVGFWDTAEFQTVGPVLGTAHPTGYPTYVILSWVANGLLAPVGEPAFRMNLLSAIFVAVAAGLTVLLVRRLTGSVAIAIAAALGLATTPIAWSIGTRADPHALHLALVALLLLVLVVWEERQRSGDERAGWWLVGAAVVYGVAAANHSLTLLLAPPIAAYVLAVDRRILGKPRLVGACVLALAATLALLYLQLPLRSGPFPAPLVYGRPHTWDGFWYVVLAEQFRGSLVNPFGDLGGKLADVIGLAVEQLSWLAPLVPVAFVAAARRAPRYALLTGLAFAITVFFSMSYVNADIERYYLGPVLVAWTWLAILASAATDVVIRLVPSGTRLAGRAGPAIASVLAAVLLLAPTVPALPLREAALDRSRDDAARRWLDAALAELEPDAIVISWWSYSTPLWYGQHVEGRRADVFIADDRTRLDRDMGEITDVIEENLGRRPVYVIRPANEIAMLEVAYRLERTAAASLYRVADRREAGA